MEMHSRSDGDIVLLALRGHCETDDLPALKAQVDGFIEGGARKLCLNFAGLSFLNSTALGYLVATAKRLGELGGQLVLSEPSRFFAATIRTLELHHIFEIFPHDDAALQHLAGS
jgi:anti-sigma B factor antagonist